MSALSTLRRKPRVVLLDLRPLQCGYAGRGIGRYTAELAPRLAARLKARESKRGRPLFSVFSLVVEGEPNPLPDIPVKFCAPPWKRMWLWDRFVLPWMLLRHDVS